MIKDNYNNGECPDCNDPIPDDMVTGGECINCGHVFQDEYYPEELDNMIIKDEVKNLVELIKFKVTTRNMPKTDICNVFNELLAGFKNAGDCDFLHDKSVTISDLLLNLAGFETSDEDEETDEETIIGVYHNQGAYSDEYNGNFPLMTPILVATVSHPAKRESFELGKGTLKLINDAWDKFVETEPDTDTQFEQFLIEKYGLKSGEGKPHLISIYV
jgi:hypothetical protein